LAEREKFLRVLGGRVGEEVMVWTAGGHYFRGILQGINEDGFLVLDYASCTCAGERHERDRVFVNLESVDATS